MLTADKPVWETGWVLWWAVSAWPVLKCLSPLCLQPRLCHCLLQGPCDSLTLREPGQHWLWDSRESVCQCIPAAVWNAWNKEFTTVLSLGPGPCAAFLRTQNPFDPKVTDGNDELWCFQPSNIGKQNPRKNLSLQPCPWRLCWLLTVLSRLDKLGSENPSAAHEPPVTPASVIY